MLLPHGIPRALPSLLSDGLGRRRDQGLRPAVVHGPAYPPVASRTQSRYEDEPATTGRAMISGTE